MYVKQLKEQYQQEIEKALKDAGLAKEDIETAMDSKIKDLSDVITLKKEWK